MGGRGCTPASCCTAGPQQWLPCITCEFRQDCLAAFCKLIAACRGRLCFLWSAGCLGEGCPGVATRCLLDVPQLVYTPAELCAHVFAGVALPMAAPVRPRCVCAGPIAFAWLDEHCNMP